MRELGLQGNKLDIALTEGLLGHLSTEQGFVGLTARLVSARFTASRAAKGAAPIAPTPANRAGRKPRSELVALLAHALGEEKSEEVIVASARKLAIDDTAFNRQEALSILEELSTERGVVGVTAKFAKARAILRFES
jgi:hypothetical protein